MQKNEKNMRGVASQFRDLCQNPETQVVLVSDRDCMSGIPSFLASKDKEVLKSTLQGLKFLSANPLAQPQLAKHNNLITMLYLLQREQEVDAPAISGMCTSILEDLESYSTLSDDTAQPGALDTPNKEPKSTSEGKSSARKQRSGRKSLGGGKQAKLKKKRKLYTIVLVIDNTIFLAPPAVNSITMACLQVKGILSATCTMNQVILTSTRKEASVLEPLVSAIAGSGFVARSLKATLLNAQAQQMSTAAQGRSSLSGHTYSMAPSYLQTSSGRRPMGRMSLAEVQLPSYIDESVFNDDDDDYTGVEGVPNNKHAIVQHQDFVDASLEAQFVKKRKNAKAKEEQENQVKGFVSQMSSFLFG